MGVKSEANNVMTEIAELEVSNQSSLAIEVLKECMLFYRDQAPSMISQIITLLKKQNTRSDLLQMMRRLQAENSESIVYAAAKLAPYENPKLNSVQAKINIQENFTIREPSLADNPTIWLQNVKTHLKHFALDQPNNLPQIEHVPTQEDTRD